MADVASRLDQYDDSAGPAQLFSCCSLPEVVMAQGQLGPSTTSTSLSSSPKYSRTEHGSTK